MAQEISGLLGASVGGNHATNRPEDVKVIQHILNRIGGGAALPEDGVLTPALVARIEAFQRDSLHFLKPDGRVDPGHRTLEALLKAAAAAAPPPAAPPEIPPSVKVDGALHALVSAARPALTDADFIRAAGALGSGISPALVRAFAEVESGGKTGFSAAGNPKVAFEGHWFRKLTNKRYDKSHPLLSYIYREKAGPQWQANNKDDNVAWSTLKRAEALDSPAARQACSWGMFQVMGFNYAKCGYKNVDAFVDAMVGGAGSQLDAFVGFCKGTKGLVPAMQQLNFVRMATLYNGEQYGDYDRRIKKAYAKYSAA
jgi:hypothetical protein